MLRFAERQAERLVLVGHSPPLSAHRATWRALRGSGPGILPYLAANHLLPPIGAAFRRPRRLSGLCAERGIRTLRLADEAGMQAALRETGAELLVSFHLDRILGAAVLAAPARGGINVHPSLLPRHRGPIPAFFGLAEGATGVSVHALAPRIDAGGIWAQREVSLPPGASALAAARALHLAALPLLDAVLDRIEAGEEAPAPPRALPYRGWPEAAERRRAGVRLLGRGDVTMAWRAPAGGWRS
ncbi:formyltransferase family protein [Roseococcus sp. SYP-B2431]|uniref:formyltransferase family protein n=1 Tax=Roseococcus sp. SYP-B2431 TaxID=2496640 RepID=UPI00197ED3EB|nr:formyltransferase family protein [Roseococcus sp. SYP-B2431]